ncbi:hypothetical protein BC628DRAFT_1407768 [Trametes gibbosa]|nr:hypothetical protein BC628DRAFT_1407768 [Trametes gibbosa]
MAELSTHPSFGAAEDRSLLPWLDESTAPLLGPPADCTKDAEDLIESDSPMPSDALPLDFQAPTGLAVASLEKPSAQDYAPEVFPIPTSASKAIPDVRPPLKTPWFPDPLSRNVEGELRATVDALLRRKKASQRGLVEENAALREEVGFLRHALRLASPEDSDAKQLAAALEQERTGRLRSVEKLDALVHYLAEQLASSNEQRSAAEKALATSERDCMMWEDKLAAAMKHCEVLEEENTRVKSSLGLFARQRPTTVRQQMQGMLYEVAEERANLKRLEVFEQQTAEKLGETRPEARKLGTLNYPRRGTRKVKGHVVTQPADLCWTNVVELDS